MPTEPDAAEQNEDSAVKGSGTVSAVGAAAAVVTVGAGAAAGAVVGHAVDNEMTVSDAAASVQSGAAAAGDIISAAAEDTASDAASVAQAAATTTAAAVSDGAREVLALVPDSVKEDVSQVVQTLGDVLSPEQMQAAAATLSADLEELGGSAAAGGAAVLAAVGGALAQAGEMAPDVVESVSAALGSVSLAIGPALGPIGISVGLLGALVHTFRMSKENDKNVSTVTLWAASVKDWLLMVTSKVENSAFSSTLALFEGLQAEMKGMFAQIDKHNKKWRVSKMLSSSTFKQDFDRAKTSVLELKSALHAFLDQEAQDAQEKKLAEVAQSAIEVAAKLDTMDAQLAEIREMLTAANQKDPTEAQLDEESLIYARLQQAADRTGDLPFKLFVPTFEMFFFDNGTLDKAQTRALKIALDRDNTGKVTKPYFIKFFRAWKESGMTMQAYMQKLADEAPPTLFAEGIANAEHLAEAASDKVSALLHSDKAVAAKAAAEKAAHDAKEGLKNIGGSLFGKKSPAKEPAAKEEAA